MQPEALRLTYIWIVHSDLDENNLYSEFGSEAQALAYARRHAEDLTWVEKVEVAVDEFDEIVEYHDGETIWVYDDESKDSMNQPPRPQVEELEDDEEDETVEYQDCGTIVNKSDCLRTDGGTYVCKYCQEDFDSLVETLEENEDIVECKECFELFPKSDCIKLDVGYICPTCHQHCEGPDCHEFDLDDIAYVELDDDLVFKIDFPELERFDYGNDMIPDESTPEIENGLLSDSEPTPEIENDPISEPVCVDPECATPIEPPVTKDETITKLVIDEHEAIEGYEQARLEIEENSGLDEEEKKEILDALEHIKEEEVEHIEELEELGDNLAPETKEADEPSEESDSEETEESEVLVEGSGFFGKVILDDYFKKDGGRNPENKNGTGYWVDLIDPTTKESIIKPEDKKTVQKLKDAETIATQLSKAEDGWAIIRVEGAQGWNGILEVYEKGKRTQDITQKKLANLNKTWDEQKAKKKARQKLDKKLGKDKPEDAENIDLPGETEQPTEDQSTTDNQEVVDTTATPKNAAAVKANKEYKKIIDALKKIGIADSEISKLIQGKKPTDALKELRKLLFTESLEEHVNEEHPAVESDQVLVGTDNAVVDCEVADVITHSEDEKPLDCKMEEAPLEKPLTEDTHAKYAKPEGDRIAAYNNALKYAKKENKPFIYGYTNHTGKFFAAETPMKVADDPADAEKEFRSRYKNCNVIYVVYPDKEFIKEELFTKAEQEEYNMDEEGYSLNSHDQYVRCGWCGEIFPKYECVFEKDFGWLCSRCQDELKSHGGRLDIIVNPTEEDIKDALDWVN